MNVMAQVTRAWPLHARFDGPMVMIGFGSIGRGTLPLLERHIAFDRKKFVVIAPEDEDRGLLVTASCSARVSAEQFADAVKEAAFKARVDLQLVQETRQPADHPVTLQFREGRYLKCMVLRRIA